MSENTTSGAESAEQIPAAPIHAKDPRKIKISCHNCLQKLDVSELDPFSVINCPECSSELIVPKWFDNYLLEETGGVGGMATVYRAMDVALDREVAVKILASQFASTEASVKLFLHEARTAATINHFAVVPVYTCGICGGEPFIVMQYMSGGSLDSKLKLSKNKLPKLSVLHWIKDAAEGLDCARINGIVHHDVKPANIMLDGNEKAKICDFGISQLADEKNDENVGKWLSPYYVSPEKVTTGTEDYRGDIYSLGVTFYQLLTGKLPFDAPETKDLIVMRLSMDPVEPRKIEPELSREISDLVMAMMNRDPARRPSYKDISKTIEESLQPRDNSANRTERMKKISIPADRDGNAVSKKSSGILWKAVAALLIAALLAGGAYYKFYRPSAAASTLNIPNVSEAIAFGEIGQAGTLAEKIFRNFSEPAPRRIAAALQMGMCRMLIKDENLKELCSNATELLKVIETNNGMTGAQSPSRTVMGILGGASPEIVTMDSADESMLAAVRLAVFLRSVADNRPKEELRIALNGLKTALIAVPDGWMASWKVRIPVWESLIENGKSDKQEEPLFARFAGKTGTAVKQAPSVKGFSAAEIQAAAAAWSAVRPKPGNAAALAGIPGEYATTPREKARVELVRTLPGKMERLLKRFPCRLPVFANTSGKTFSGVSITANSNGYFLKHSGEKTRKKISPSDFTPASVIGVLRFYADRKGGLGPELDAGFRADCADIAVASAWLGDYATAEHYAAQASKNPECRKCLTALLLEK